MMRSRTGTTSPSEAASAAAAVESRVGCIEPGCGPRLNVGLTERTTNAHRSGGRRCQVHGSHSGRDMRMSYACSCLIWQVRTCQIW